jgi:predicted membrane protein
MMPHLLRLQVRQTNHRTFRLWIPVLPVLIVLSPLLLLAALAAGIACLRFRINPIRALVAAGRLLCALKGTQVEVDQPEALVLLDIR